MRPVRIIATAVVIAALAGTGCASRSADQTGPSVLLKPFVSPPDQPDRRPNHPANRRVDRNHNPNHGHPDQPQMRPLADHGTSGISGHPCLPRVRSL